MCFLLFLTPEFSLCFFLFLTPEFSLCFFLLLSIQFWLGCFLLFLTPDLRHHLLFFLFIIALAGYGTCHHPLSRLYRRGLFLRIGSRAAFDIGSNLVGLLLFFVTGVAHLQFALQIGGFAHLAPYFTGAFVFGLSLRLGFAELLAFHGYRPRLSSAGGMLRPSF